MKLTNVIGWSAGVFLMAELVFIFVVY